MTTLLLTVCFAVSATQDTPKTIDGSVVDSKGKPISGVEVVATLGMNAEGAIPVFAGAKTDDKGHFQLPVPALDARRGASNMKPAIWVGVPGRGVAGTLWDFDDRTLDRPIRLDLDKPSPHSVRVETNDGKPLVVRESLLNSS